jgi:hypothetical protein
VLSSLAPSYVKVLKVQVVESFPRLQARKQMTAPAYIANVCDKVGNGDRRLDVMTLIRLADLYGKPPEFFLKPE